FVVGVFNKLSEAVSGTSESFSLYERIVRGTAATVASAAGTILKQVGLIALAVSALDEVLHPSAFTKSFGEFIEQVKKTHPVTARILELADAFNETAKSLKTAGKAAEDEQEPFKATADIANDTIKEAADFRHELE